MESKEKENEGPRHIPDETSFGPLVAAIVIVILLILGGLYALKNNSQNPLPPTFGAARDGVIDSIVLYDISDDLEKIQKDLAATSIQAVERGLEPLSKKTL